jgi:prepilin-type N-terminal cleavage/methylation domain-containing protein
MTSHSRRLAQTHAFTLVEMLVVIAIIGVLAGMLIPVGTMVVTKSKIKQTQAQMNQISTLIENYKAKLGHYPPENPNDPRSTDSAALPARPPLLYELTGAELVAGRYRTVRGSAFTSAELTAAFGVRMIANSTKPGGNPDDASQAQNFAPNLDPNSLASVVVNPTLTVEVLASKIAGPAGSINVWHYSAGRVGNHNPNSFDLWIDLKLGSKTNRVCNWSEKPIVLP